jgi:hypothetical protein
VPERVQPGSTRRSTRDSTSFESPRFDGLVGMYRWYVHDPIHFAQSLRWTIEHGHANNFASGYASVAYWYQALADREDAE